VLGIGTERGRKMVAGAVVITLVSAVVIVGVRAANGAFRPRYQLLGTFASAGQGLLAKSDVKIRGVNIGSVESIRLVGGRALVRMDIDDDEPVPVSATATIRPKTLFGEKFVDIDPGAGEADGPFLGDEDPIRQTTSGFELEKVLSDAFPLLKAIDGDELATILSELSAAGKGLGPTVNRTIVNTAAVLDQQNRRAAELGRFLDDLALLAESLEGTSSDLVATSRDLNRALPGLNARSAQLSTTLDQAARLSADVADLLEANRPFLEKGITEGGKVLQVLYERRDRIPGLVRGLRYFFEVLGSVGRIELGDGTRLAAVKGILGGGPPCGRTVMGCPLYEGPPAGSTATAATASSPSPGPNRPSGPIDGVSGLPAAQDGVAGVIGLVESLLR
jgi:phospholipid/cholesterol/gamma-HCH transport system substrate-binding protein